MQGEERQSSHLVTVWLELLLPEWGVFSEEEEAELDRKLMKMCKKFDEGHWVVGVLHDQSSQVGLGWEALLQAF